MARRTIGRGRGRPASGYSYKERRVLEQLARIAVKHKLDSTTFFESIKKAWTHEEVRCKPLVITCREKLKHSASFLFTIKRDVIAQFPITVTILQGRNQLDSYMKPIAASFAKKVEIISPKIGDLKMGMKRVDMKVEVLKLSEPKMVYTRYGSTAFVSSAMIKDETGSIRMSLWNHQRSKVHKGDTISIKNGKVGWYSGELYLNLGRTGSFDVVH